MTTQTPQSFDTAMTGGDPTPSAGSASARERAAQVSGTAKDQATEVAQEARDQARDLVGEARSQVRQQLDTQKGRLSDLLREIADDLEQMAGGSDREGLAADLVRQAAARTRDARGYLDGNGDLLGDVRRFARRRPGTFLLGALAAGVVAGRATRAAAAARRQQDSGSGSATWTGGTAAAATPSTSPGYASPGYSGEYGSYRTGSEPVYPGTTAETHAAGVTEGTYTGTGVHPTGSEAGYGVQQPAGGYTAPGGYAASEPMAGAAGYPEAPAYPAPEYPAGGAAGTGYAVPDDTVVTEAAATREYPAEARPEREERP